MESEFSVPNQEEELGVILENPMKMLTPCMATIRKKITC